MNTKQRYREIDDLVTTLHQNVIGVVDDYASNGEAMRINHYLKTTKSSKNWLVRILYQNVQQKDWKTDNILLRHCNGKSADKCVIQQKSVLVASNGQSSIQDRRESTLTLQTDIGV